MPGSVKKRLGPAAARRMGGRAARATPGQRSAGRAYLGASFGGHELAHQADTRGGKMSADLSVSGGEITPAGQAKTSGWFVNRSHKITLKPSTVQNSRHATSRSPGSPAAHLRERSRHSAARMSSTAPADPATRASFSG